MHLCRICKQKEATKKNSHVITWALIRDAINQPGFKERGYDVTFSISSLKAPSLFAGQSVLPPHLERVTNRNTIDDVINFETNPLSYDYIFCPECEKKIGVLENEFITHVYRKLDTLNLDSLPSDKKGNHFFNLSMSETRLTCKRPLFRYSFRLAFSKLRAFCYSALSTKRLIPIFEGFPFAVCG